MKYARFFIFLFILILPACVSTLGTGYATYSLHDTNAQFSIEYPRGWFIDDQNRDTEGMYYVRFSPQAKNSSTALLILFEDKAKFTKEDFIRFIQNDLERLSKPCSREEVIIDGAPRVRLICEGYPNVFFEGEKQYYVLSYTASPYTKEFERMIQHFHAL